MAVLDSSAIIHILNGTPFGQRILSRFKKEITATTAVSINEVLVGYSENDQKKALDFFEALDILPFNSEAAWKSVSIERRLLRKGKMIQKTDVFIGSICTIYSLPLITSDTGFRSIEGLEVWMVE